MAKGLASCQRRHRQARSAVRDWFRRNDVTYKITRTADSAPEGTVIDVSPTGTVELGQQVTVTVSRGPG